MASNANRTTGTGQSTRLVIAASSLGTVFEWYDFYLYGLACNDPVGAILLGR